MSKVRISCDCLSHALRSPKPLAPHRDNTPTARLLNPTTTKPAQPIAIPSNLNRIRPNDAYAPRPPVDAHRPAVPIAIPTNRNVPRPTVEKTYEDFDLHVAENTVEYRVSDEDAEKALRDLMADVGATINQEIDMSEAVVPGFKEGIVLLPHQVIGRKWMAERESGKRAGGILADDMG